MKTALEDRSKYTDIEITMKNIPIIQQKRITLAIPAENLVYKSMLGFTEIVI